jgi:hypothetical protein
MLNIKNWAVSFNDTCNNINVWALNGSGNAPLSIGDTIRPNGQSIHIIGNALRSSTNVILGTGFPISSHGWSIDVSVQAIWSTGNPIWVNASSISVIVDVIRRSGTRWSSSLPLGLLQFGGRLGQVFPSWLAKISHREKTPAGGTMVVGQRVDRYAFGLCPWPRRRPGWCRSGG